MSKLSREEEKSSLDFFRRHNVPEDPNFNPKRNQAIIDKTIKKNDALVSKRRKEFRGGLAEQIDAVGYYFRSQHGAHSSTPIMRYLGKRWMAKLRGEQIMKQLQDTLMVKNRFGKITRKPGEVTIRH